MAGVNSILETAKSRLLDAVSKSVGDAAKTMSLRIKARTPINRRKTRRHTTHIHRRGELSAVAGVIFPSNSRYETEGTKTREIVERSFREESESILRQIANQLTAAASQQPLTVSEIRKG